MKKIIVLTATRAEYSLLRPVIIKLKKIPEILVEVAVTGMHLSPAFGETYKEIENDNIAIDKKIEILLSSDSAIGMSKAMGLAMIGFSDYFSESKPDALLVLGDRFETLAVCCAAMNAQIPIFHMHGGELTEGLIDEAVRHSISKMSYLHFTSTETYRKRVIQLGESPERVYNVGAIGVENALNTPLLSKDELENSLGIKLEKPYILITFHPVTLEVNNVENQCDELLDVIIERQEFDFIITKANADCGGRLINERLEQASLKYKHIHCYDSLGMRRYLSAIKYSAAVLGNSSSGLIEAPSFHVPTINIGNRQRGRIQAATVINCRINRKDINAAIDKAISPKFIENIRLIKNPYGNGNTSEKILQILKEKFLNSEIEIKKKFYDIDFTI